MRRIYCDNNATTPVKPEVLEAMMPFYREDFGNASSVHLSGRRARVALEDAREQVATLLGADTEEIFFTAGGTESNNMAIRGSLKDRGSRRRIVTSRIEHHAVLHTVEDLEKNDGVPVTYIRVDHKGLIHLEDVQEGLGDDVILLTLIHANNEVGTIQDIATFTRLAHESGVIFHTDAVQSVGKIPIDVHRLEVNMLSLSAHKLGGPKGIGALYIRKGLKLRPIMTGGHHERGLRPGTENVPGIVGLGKACELALKQMDETSARARKIRDEFERHALEKIPQITVNAREALRLPGTSNISFFGIDGESLLIKLDMAGVEVSTGSACTSESLEPSHVLLAMGVEPRLAQSSLRFSFGWNNKPGDADEIMKVLPKIVDELRAITIFDNPNP